MTGEFPHYRIIKGRGYWIPTPAMKQMGFKNIACGQDGHEARAIALRWEQRYQDARRGKSQPTRYPRGTVGWAFEEIRSLKGWQRKPLSTREEWERSWQHIEPIFGDVPPGKISLKLLDHWYYTILEEHNVDIAWRAMKIWRSLYNQMAAMKLCAPGEDPSLKIQRISQNKRSEYWTEGEISRLIKGAIRLNMLALACIISIAWDTIFQPGDARTLRRRELFQVGKDWVINRGRLKIKGDAKVIGWVKRRSRRLLECYLRSLVYSLHPDALIFRTRGYQPAEKGGRPRSPAPYTKNTLSKDFRILRKTVFGPEEKRKLMDLRRSGTMEAVIGDASTAQIGQALGNNFEHSKMLQSTYAPNHLASVKEVDAARKAGRRRMGTVEHQFKPLKFEWETDPQPTDE